MVFEGIYDYEENKTRDDFYILTNARKPFYLILQYYLDTNLERQDEIDACLHYNATNPFIDKIIVLVEDGRCEINEFKNRFKEDKIEAFLFPRIKFNNFFEFCREKINHNYICAICNNDIILSKTIDWGYCLPHPNLVQTLTRHEIYNQNKAKIDELAYLKAWCNDLWIFTNPVRKMNHIDFQIGDNPSCDNAINHRFAEAGYWCINEAHKYINYHIDFAPSRKCIGEMKMVAPSDKKEHQAWSNPAKEGAYFTPITGEWKEHKPPFKILDLLPKLKDKYHSSFFTEYDTLKL
jgi:hypothetical protein